MWKERVKSERIENAVEIFLRQQKVGGIEVIKEVDEGNSSVEDISYISGVGEVNGILVRNLEENKEVEKARTERAVKSRMDNHKKNLINNFKLGHNGVRKTSLDNKNKLEGVDRKDFKRTKKKRTTGSIIKSAELKPRQSSTKLVYDKNSNHEEKNSEKDKFSKNQLKILSKFDLMKSNSSLTNESRGKASGLQVGKNPLKRQYKSNKFKPKTTEDAYSPFSRHVPLKITNSKVFNFTRPQIFFEKNDAKKKNKSKPGSIYKDFYEKKTSSTKVSKDNLNTFS